jgi:hypothetical protein
MIREFQPLRRRLPPRWSWSHLLSFVTNSRTLRSFCFKQEGALLDLPHPLSFIAMALLALEAAMELGQIVQVVLKSRQPFTTLASPPQEELQSNHYDDKPFSSPCT